MNPSPVTLSFPCSYTAGCTGAFVVVVSPKAGQPTRGDYRAAVMELVGGSSACTGCGTAAGITGKETLEALERELDKLPNLQRS